MALAWCGRLLLVISQKARFSLAERSNSPINEASLKIDYAGVFHIPSYYKGTHIEYVPERKQNVIEGKMGNQLRFKMKRSKK